MALAVMHDQRELIQPLIIGDEAVRAVERVIMFLALHLKGRLHRLAAKGRRLGMLRPHSAASRDFQLST